MIEYTVTTRKGLEYVFAEKCVLVPPSSNKPSIALFYRDGTRLVHTSHDVIRITPLTACTGSLTSDQDSPNTQTGTPNFPATIIESQRVTSRKVFYALCTFCGAEGPDGMTPHDANKLAEDEGFTINGNNEYVCADCK